MTRWGALAPVVPIVVLLESYFRELGDVRECQIEGGHWDYASDTCRAQPQPFVSFRKRHPWVAKGGMLLSVAGLVMCFLGLYVKRR